ncbi:MAG: SpoIID/LytB domain-containing protein [Chlorobi bacterium]|nr:SpoIID/LytB domain-containing protein [Chlorobiota bacterium]
MKIFTRIKYFLLILFLFISLFGFSKNIKVRIFSEFQIKTSVVRLISGKYDFIADGKRIYRIKKNNVIYFTATGDSINVWDLDEHLGVFKNIEFIGKGRTNSFRIEPVFPALKERSYYGNLQIKVKDKFLLIVNNADLESYVSGVVESESGPKATEEYYKSQAIICRTYALGHLNRHIDDGFNLCDGVHCQVYKNMSHQNYQIPEATFFTSGLILVDTANQIITAAFHSNSGGETANSEDVWSSSTSYLKAVKDTFSLNQRNAKWEKKITYLDWLNYLDTIGIDTRDGISEEDMKFIQDSRKKYILIKNDTINVKKIRSDFGLRSAYFSIIPEEDYMLFKGKGYGHGVGLSQEGAMNMSKQGYNFREIIHFYYTNVKIIKLENLKIDNQQ